MMLYDQTEFGCKKISNSEDMVEMTFDMNLDNNPIFSHGALCTHNAWMEYTTFHYKAFNSSEDVG